MSVHTEFLFRVCRILCAAKLHYRADSLHNRGIHLERVRKLAKSAAAIILRISLVCSRMDGPKCRIMRFDMSYYAIQLIVCILHSFESEMLKILR